jgi:putative ABC transport system permease protein
MLSLLTSSLAAGLETLRLNPLRTLLSTLGIIMGVGALVAVLSLGDGMEAFARKQIESTTDLQAVNISPVFYRTVDGERFPRTDVVQFEAADADSIQRIVGQSATVMLAMNGQALVTTAIDTTPRVAMVSGTLETVASDIGSFLTAGKLFTRADVDTGANVVVLSQELARRLFPKRAPAEIVGERVRFQGAEREVIAVLDSVPRRGGSFAIMPLTVSKDAIAPALVGRAAAMTVTAAKVEDVTIIRDSAEQWLARVHGAKWKELVSVNTNEMRVAQVQQGMMIFKLFMGALTGISLLVGGIGIMNVLLASVVERTREIGIRRATGALKRHVLMQFLSESVTITAAGSLVGVLLGVGGAYAATAIMRSMSKAEIHAGFSLSTFLVAVTASVVVGVAFGIYPALRASRLSPIDAIRHE